MDSFKKRVQAVSQRWAARAKRRNEARARQKKLKRREARACKFKKVWITHSWIVLEDGITVALDQRGYYRTQEGRLYHRLVYQKAHGSIPFDWIVHHVNLKKTDNAPENLIAIPQWFHEQVHEKIRQTRSPMSRLDIISEFKGVNLSPEDEKGVTHLVALEQSIMTKRVVVPIAPLPKPRCILRKQK